MKIRLFALAVIMGVFSSCEKEEKNGFQEPIYSEVVSGCVIEGALVSTLDQNNQSWYGEYRYRYNSVMQLSSMEYSNKGDLDLVRNLSYNTDRTLDNIVDYLYGVPSGHEVQFNYHNGTISEIIHTANDNSLNGTLTYSLVWDRGNLVSSTHNGAGFMELNTALYQDGDLTSGSVTFENNGTDITVDFSAVYDDQASINLGVPFEGDNFFDVSSEHNVELVLATSAVPGHIEVGDTLLYRKYAFSSEGSVRTVIDRPAFLNDFVERTETIGTLCH